MHLKPLFSVILAALLILCVHSEAQVMGELRGQVNDRSGATISGAKVVLTANATGVLLETATTSTGEYSYSQLTSGVYSVEVSQAGFSNFTRKGVTVTTGGTVRVDVTLPVATGNDSVQVDADVPLLQAATSNISTTIPGGTVRTLPLNSRNFVQLTQMAPGVELPPGTLLPRINGGRPRTNEYLFDGISALQPEPGQVAFFPILIRLQSSQLRPKRTC